MFAYWAAAILFLSLALGGATHGEAITSLVARLLCVGLLTYCLWMLPRDRPSAATLLGLGLFVLIALLALAQLVPLPAETWTKLPGRGFLVETFKTAGLPLPPLPLSLTPDATLDLLPGLAAPAAMFLAAARCNSAGRRILVLALLGGAIASLLLAALQLTGGQDSPLRIYEVTNDDAGVGFFANRNHQAALLVCAIPLTVYCAAWIIRRGGMTALAATALALGGVLLLIVGLGITLSRAGVILGGVALVGSLLMIMRTHAYPGRKLLAWSLLGTAVVGAALVFLFAFGGLSGRFNKDPGQDMRVAALPTIIQTAQAFSPVGAGFGAFVPAYQMREPASLISPQFLNHAHDDYLELWVDGGWAGLALVGLVALWWLWRSAAAWSTSREEAELQRAASVVIFTLLAHSALDYPLRTIAVAAAFGLACGLMTPKSLTGYKDRVRP